MDKYQIIDKMGVIVATAQIRDDALYAAKKYDAKHIYNVVTDQYERVSNV